MNKVHRFTVWLAVCTFAGLTLSAQNTDSTAWSKRKAHKWFQQKAWLEGAPLKPHPSINEQEFARQYQLNRPYWEAAFKFLKEHDLASLAPGKYPIDGDHVYVSVTMDSTKDFDKTNWESHRKYIDLQCVITGEEKMGKSPVAAATVIKPYNPQKDVANYTAPGKFYTLQAGTFIIFFPGEAHRPNIAPNGRQPEKKLVIKIEAAE